MKTERTQKLQEHDASVLKHVLGGVYAPLALLLGGALVMT